MITQHNALPSYTAHSGNGSCWLLCRQIIPTVYLKVLSNVFLRPERITPRHSLPPCMIRDTKYLDCYSPCRDKNNRVLPDVLREKAHAVLLKEHRNLKISHKQPCLLPLNPKSVYYL